MLRFDARGFSVSLSVLDVLSEYANKVEALDKLNTEVSEDVFQSILKDIEGVTEACRSAGLATSVTILEDALIMLKPHGLQKQPTWGLVREQLGGAWRTALAELKSVIFLRIEKHDEQYYESQDLFGIEVAANFSDAKYDISEAGKCLALDRSTACVLHLMRVLELGLNSLAGHFQIPFAHVNWNTVIDQIESKIRGIDKDPNKPATWKDDRKFYSEAANQLRYFKDSWRNYAMHVHDKYTPEEALIIYTSVKVFMKQVAKRLKQPV